MERLLFFSWLIVVYSLSCNVHVLLVSFDRNVNFRCISTVNMFSHLLET